MKRILSALMVVFLLLMLAPVGYAAADEALTAAQELNALGLFSGTGTDEQGNPLYELERQPTRQESITMLVKLLGGTEEALKGGWNTPFIDVDNWAKDWVGYAYNKGLTAGISATTFGANDKTTTAQFLTFVLKALGYDANSDFSWDNAWPLAEQVGLSNGEYNAQTIFARGDMALISYRALSAKPKGSDKTLSEVLFGEKEVEESFFDIHFIDVGQADAALIRCDGEAMLVDGGNRGDSDTMYSVLQKAGLSHLKIVVGTHAHEDHIGGLPGAFNYADAEITLCPVKSYTSDVFADFARYANQRGGGITVPAVGDTYMLGSAKVEILGVNSGEDTNDTSIVLMITYGQTKFLFTGDAEREAEQAILDSGVDLSATVLKVGHHGSESSTTYPFLREIMPEYAVISVGTENTYGHPTQETLSRLRDAGVTVYRTDMQGDIRCTSDGKTIIFTTGRAAVEENQPQDEVGTEYILNTSTKKFHYPTCKSVKTIKQENVGVFSGRREMLLEQGYNPCGNCKP